MPESLRVTVWGENVHERKSEVVRRIYPDGMHNCLEESEHGPTKNVLAETDVLLWWGHAAHDEVADEVVERVVSRVRDGIHCAAFGTLRESV